MEKCLAKGRRKVIKTDDAATEFLINCIMLYTYIIKIHICIIRQNCIFSFRSIIFLPHSIQWQVLAFPTISHKSNVYFRNVLVWCPGLTIVPSYNLCNLSGGLSKLLLPLNWFAIIS
jgi:hypothetical protein